MSLVKEWSVRSVSVKCDAAALQQVMGPATPATPARSGTDVASQRSSQSPRLRLSGRAPTLPREVPSKTFQIASNCIKSIEQNMSNESKKDLGHAHARSGFVVYRLQFRGFMGLTG